MGEEIYFSDRKASVIISDKEIDLKDVTILIVDDSVSIRKVITSRLTGFGLRIIEAKDGAEGVELAKSEKPSLILLDIKMPNMDGFQACAKLREDPETASIPVVFLTQVTEVSEKIKAYKLGALDFLNKPIDVITLVARVKSILSSIKIIKELKRLEIEKKEAERWAHSLMKMKSKMAIFDMDLLYKRIDEEIKKGISGSYPVSMFLVDMNRLTVLNKRYGFLYGDKVMKETERILREIAGDKGSFLNSNTDKFFLILPEFSERNTVRICAEALSKIGNLTKTIGNLSFGDKISANIGGITYEKKVTISSKIAYELTEKALQESKDSGPDKKLLYYLSNKPLSDGTHQIDRIST